jgi:uncharacterized membrane protein YgcG
MSRPLFSVFLFLGLVGSFRLNAFSPDRFTPNIVDRAHLLSDQEKRAINETISKIRTQADILAAVYIVESLQGESIEAAANQTFEKWALGTKGKDNGLLFMFSMRDRRMRLEVGYGLEGTIPDIAAKRIISDQATPLFRSEQFAEGITRTLLTAAATHLRSRGVSDSQIQEQLGEGYAPVQLGRQPGHWTLSDFNWTLYGIWIAFLIGGQLLRLSKPRTFQIKNQKVPFRIPKSPFFERVFILGFLAINPGCFILLVPKDILTILSHLIAENYARVLHDIGNAVLSHTVKSPAFCIWIVAIWYAPIAIKRLAFSVAEKRGVPTGKWINPIFRLPPHKRFSAHPARFGLVLPFFILPVPVFGILLLVLGFYQTVSFIGIVSPKFYRRHFIGRFRLQRLRSRVVGTREVFGKVYTYRPPSSSSSSSSSRSSSSSSSSGGRSGGGGASGSW